MNQISQQREENCKGLFNLWNNLPQVPHQNHKGETFLESSRQKGSAQGGPEPSWEATVYCLLQ